jgi:hypothetical protein
VRAHTTSKQELDALRSVIERDLRDAALCGLSEDRRLATAYNAALLLAKMAAACAGYPVSGVGTHQTSFQASELTIGSTVSNLAAYFETCRCKRNTLDYAMAYIISDSEVNEILEKTAEFRREVEAWIANHHPHLMP